MREFWEATRAGLRAYETIVENLMGYPRQREQASAMNLGWSMDCHRTCWALEVLHDRLNGKDVCVLGPAWNGKGLSSCRAVLAPEGSIPLLLRLGVPGDLITADVDVALKYIGMVPAVARALALHLHGDNIPRFSQVALNLGEDLPRFYTTQVETTCCVVPVGAFTDGDRAAAIAMYMGASSIRLLGFNSDLALCEHKDFCYGSLKPIKVRLGLVALDSIATALGYSKHKMDDGTVVYARRF